MKAIFKRELNAYFNSMLGYIFLALFLVISAVLFFTYNILNGEMNMNMFFQSILTFSLFVIPIITMRLFAEERHQKTDQLLLTSPVSVTSIVLGKFFAAMGVISIALLITAIFPFVESFYGKLSIAEIISAYIGFLFFAGSIVSIGCFMSSLTDSQIIAAITTYGVILVMLFLGFMVGNTITNDIAVKILDYLIPLNKFSDFAYGILNIEPIVYYLSVMAVLLFATVSKIESRRWR